MATTESRTGFRLPWSAERAASRDDFEESPANDSSAPDDETATAAAEDVQHPAAWAAEPAAPLGAIMPPALFADPAPARRPTKFLVDLTHAMQVAAEQARAATLEQFRVDGTAYVEQIQGRSVADAGALRKRAEDDVASIKDWSKTEIARIREETETRITGRRGQLDDQLARHAALVEEEVARIEAQIAAFEGEMAVFFDELRAETDLTLLAAHAQQMPEAPAFDEPDETAFNALMTEPAVGIPAPASAVEPEPEVAPEPALEIAPVGEMAIADALDPTAESLAAIADAGTAVADAAEPVAGEPVVAESSATEVLPIDPEAAMSAIQAAAEAAAALETEMIGTPEAAAAPDPAPRSGLGASGQDIDPRLAMLGLTPDFAAAEAAAAEAAAAEMQEIPEMDAQDLSARLAGLVPSSASDAPAEVGPSVALGSTQVIVTGLVSVASIASFKRHVSRAAGVRHVGVSSGPEGEFIFSVQHEAAVSLRDLIPTLPGFQARVTGGSDGTVTASAHDPED